MPSKVAGEKDDSTKVELILPRTSSRSEAETLVRSPVMPPWVTVTFKKSAPFWKKEIFSITAMMPLVNGLRSCTPLLLPTEGPSAMKLQKRSQPSSQRKSAPIWLNWKFVEISLASCGDGGPPFMPRN